MKLYYLLHDWLGFLLRSACFIQHKYESLGFRVLKNGRDLLFSREEWGWWMELNSNLWMSNSGLYLNTARCSSVVRGCILLNLKWLHTMIIFINSTNSIPQKNKRCVSKFTFRRKSINFTTRISKYTSAIYILKFLFIIIIEIHPLFNPLILPCAIVDSSWLVSALVNFQLPKSTFLRSIKYLNRDRK